MFCRLRSQKAWPEARNTNMIEGVENLAVMRVLVVEDEPRLLRNLTKALREEGYAVDTAEKGDDGLFKAETYDYDAIVLDVMLPGLDGWNVLERLRKQKRTPVLMLTARDATQDRVRGLDSGADDYLVKPFDLPELLARLRALIRRCAGQPRPKIEIGDVLLDTRGRSVTRRFRTRSSSSRCRRSRKSRCRRCESLRPIPAPHPPERHCTHKDCRESRRPPSRIAFRRALSGRR